MTKEGPSDTIPLKQTDEIIKNHLSMEVGLYHWGLPFVEYM